MTTPPEPRDDPLTGGRSNPGIVRIGDTGRRSVATGIPQRQHEFLANLTRKGWRKQARNVAAEIVWF